MLVVVFTTQAYNVSKDIQKKNILIEEFVGFSCMNSPQAYESLDILIKAQENKVYGITMHAGAFAIHNGNKYYCTDEGDILCEYFNVDYWPYCIVNRRVFNGEDYATYTDQFAINGKKINQENAPVNLWVTSKYDNNSRELMVTVEGYYTSSVDTECNYLSVVLTENNFDGIQLDGNGNFQENYIHQHILRDYISNLWGEEITSCTEGSYFEKTFCYIVPDTYDEIIPNPAEFEIIAFVTKGKTEVLNVCGDKPVCINLDLPLAANISEYRMAVQGSYGFNFFELYLSNKSNKPITSARFGINVNNGDYVAESSWSGEIPALETSYIKIPVDFEAMTIAEVNNYEIKLTNLNGQEFDGNIIKGCYTPPIECTPKLLINLKTGNSDDENTWCIKDIEGTEVHTFGPYYVGESRYYDEKIELENNNIYCFEVTDAWSNGVGGYYKLYNEFNAVIDEKSYIPGSGCRTFIKTSIETGINDVIIDNTGDVVYYNLQGIRVDNPTSGVFIKVQDSRTCKIQF